MPEHSDRFAELVAQVAAAYFANSNVAVSEIPTVMQNIASSLRSSEQREAPAEEVRGQISPTKPTASDVRRSIREDGLVSFEDGRPYKTLKRHLALRGLTPSQYREKWGLPTDYPMTAPSYSAQRSAIAKKLGLGGRPKPSRTSRRRQSSPPA